MYQRIKIPTDEKAAEVVLTSGPVYFLGDGTCIVPFETLVRLNEEKIRFHILEYAAMPRKKNAGHGQTKRKT